MKSFFDALKSQLKFLSLLSWRLSNKEVPDFESDLPIFMEALTIGGAVIVTCGEIEKRLETVLSSLDYVSSWTKKKVLKGIKKLESLEEADPDTKLAGYVGALYYVILVTQATLMTGSKGEKDYISKVTEAFEQFIEKISKEGYVHPVDERLL